MNRLLFCACGGTAWKTREEGIYSIRCDKCDTEVSHEIMSECRSQWQLEQNKLKHRLERDATVRRSKGLL